MSSHAMPHSGGTLSPRQSWLYSHRLVSPALELLHHHLSVSPVQSLRGLGSVTRFLLSTNCFLSVLPTPRAPIPSCLPATQSPHHGVQGPPTLPSRGSTSKTKLSLPPATSSPAYGCRLLRHSSRRPSAVP